jgi:hypothetical protein
MLNNKGPLFACCVAILFVWFIASEYVGAGQGYTQAERNSMNALIERNTTQDWDNLPRLSMADLTIEEVQ